MRRLLKPFAQALGLFAITTIVGSCSTDLATNPALKQVSGPLASVEGPKVVISQIYGGGGNAGATLRNDFIELFNAGTADAVVNGWSVQYASATGTTWQVTPISGVIPPGGYYLIQEAQGAGGTVLLPTPDAAGTIAMGAAAGKVALVSSTTQLLASAGPCPTAVVQIVGFGTTATCDNPTPNLSNTTAALRKTNGCTDTGVATSDFAVLAPSPRNSASPRNLCDTPPPVIASVIVAPTGAGTVVVGASETYTATARDASNNAIGGVTFTWSTGSTAIATVNASGTATGVAPGTTTVRATAPNGVFGQASLQVDVRPPDPPPAPVNVVEIHYDNLDIDVGEAIEIEGPAGYSLDGWSLVLYNQTGGAVYDTRALTGTFSDQCSGRGTLVFTYPSNGIQNGPSDGVALVRGTSVVEFLSYEGTLTATNGPAGGLTSTDIGVAEGTSSAVGRSLQKDHLGWYGPNPSSFGACNKALDPFISIVTGRANLPVGFEDQIFATLNDGRGGATPAVFTWSSDTPALASIDADGVVHAHAAGTAILRATAPSGESGTASLPLIVATTGPAVYANHVEFGTPTDGNAADDFIISRPFYTTSFNTTKGIPNWVSFNLEASHIGGGARCDCFTYDPELPAAGRYTTADYTGVGGATPYHGYPIDRGHLLRSFDRESGMLDNANTFYFSNIIPQALENNQGPWSALEIFLGDLARVSNKEIFVIAGASGSKGTVKDEGKITIPAATWKVAVILPRDRGLADVDSYDDVEVIAVIMPNDHGIRNVNWNTYRTTVDAVETLSGYDLLSLLPKKIQAVLETGMQDEMALVDALVAAGKINRGNGNSLQAKLEAAAAAVDRGDTSAAANQLEALLRELDAMDNKRLSAADASALRAAVVALIASVTA
jgi:DNA/RNA endonuclease G (NUC1)